MVNAIFSGSIPPHLGRAAAPQPSSKIKSDSSGSNGSPAAPEPGSDSKSDLAILRNDVGSDLRAAAVKESLAVGEAVTGAAIGAATKIGDLLGQAKAVAESAAEEGLDPPERQAAQEEFSRITHEIDTAARDAEFEGFNLIDPGARDISILTTEAGVDIEVQAENLSSAGLGIDKLSLGSAASAGHAAVSADGALSHTTSALARFGATATRINELGKAEIRAVIPDELRLSGKVDADLTAETAEATAAAAKDELGKSALSIANGNPAALGAAAT